MAFLNNGGNILVMKRDFRKLDICIRAGNSKRKVGKRADYTLGGYVGTIRLIVIAALGWPVGVIVVPKQIKWNEWKEENGSVKL